MTDRVLVTGGTGFTGSHLVRALVADGQQVRVLARSTTKARDLLPAEAEVVQGDVTDPDIVERAVSGQDVVYHLAAAFREPEITDERYREVHVAGTRLLLEAARDAGIRRFVHCSTIGVHGHVENAPADETTRFAPGDIYQKTKLEGEQLALRFHREHDFPVAVARPASIYGPGDLRLLKLFRMIARGRFFMLGRGEVFFHPVYVEDLVRGFRLLAERPEAVGEAFILAGERYLPLNDFTALIARVLGVPPPRLRLPVAPFYAAGAVAEKVLIPLGIAPPIYRRRVAFFTKSRAFSTAKAERLLEYRPQIDLRTGIRSTATWYHAHGYLPDAPSSSSTG
jgi:nucleoside-diphosphate-sugar epimerase